MARHYYVEDTITDRIIYRGEDLEELKAILQEEFADSSLGGTPAQLVECLRYGLPTWDLESYLGLHVTWTL